MGMGQYGRWVLVGIHAAGAILATVATWEHFRQRHVQVRDLSAIAEREQNQLIALQSLVSEQRALLTGLRSDDPYVIELLARERYRYEGADPRWQEIIPPPRAEEDRTPSAGVAQW